MSDSGISNEAALLVGSLPKGEADSLVRLYTPGLGGIHVMARGLRKPGSKLAGQLKPADELLFSATAARGAAPILTAVSCSRTHRRWQTELALLSLYWFMLECAWLASADEGSTADGFRLIVNLLRSEPELEVRHSLACVFCVRFLGLHGMLPDLFHDADTDERLSGDSYCSPAFEGLQDAATLLATGAGTHGLLRIGQGRLDRWRRLQGKPLLEYGEVQCDALDTAMLSAFTRRHVSEMGGSAVKSAEFLSQQWKLKRLSEIALSG